MPLKTAIAVLIFGWIFCLPTVKSQSTAHGKDSLWIRNITISGNHRTKKTVILRELTVKEQSRIWLSDTCKITTTCKNNLIKTSLFNFVDFLWISIDSQHVDVQITLQERWFIIPRFKIKTEEENINAWAENMNFGHLSAMLSVTDENFRGYREKLTVMGSLGFNQSVGIKYLSPSILGSRTLGAGAEIQFTQNKEVSYGLFDYKPQYYFSHSSPLISSIQLTAMAYFRPTLAIDEMLSITYAHSHFNDTLQWINRTYYPQKSMDILRIFSKLKFDFRDNKAYPLHGSYYDLLAEKIINVSTSVRKIDYMAFTINGRWFGKLGSKVYAALGTTLTTSTSSENVFPYSIRIGQSGLELRSFEQVQIPVNTLAIGRSTLKYQLLNKNRREIHFLGNPKFAFIHYALYATLFADGAYADYQRASNYVQSLTLKSNWLSSVGCGLDFSSYYDLVIRTEYSYNFAFQKYYFFLQFKAAI